MQIRDAVEELHDTLLYKALARIDADYAERASIFVRGVTPLLATIKSHFPYFTRHDAHHGFEVVRRMSECLRPGAFELGQRESLGAPELFLLIAAAYAHDLGMTVFPGERDELTTRLGLATDDTWQTQGTLQAHLRLHHSSRGGKYVESNAEALGVPQNLVTALDLLMRSHNFSIPQLENDLGIPFAAGQRHVDLRQLAAIVCVADAIEFSDGRVVDGVLDSLKLDDRPAARVSYLENMKHVCTGDSLAITQDGRIVVHGTFSDAVVLALAHRTFDQMEEWIRGYADIDRSCAVPRLRVIGEPFMRNLVLSGRRFERLGVRLNKRNVVDLIASNAVWRNSQGIALRELVQNAVEACRFRAHHSAPADKYLPAVTVTFDRTSRTVVVADNGCGMSERTVLNNLLTIGSSRSKEAAYAEADYDPIARFGIGFWSIFTIASVGEVCTAPFEPYRGKPEEAQRAVGVQFSVELDELRDYTVFAPIERPCGTAITLKLKPGIVVDEVYAATRHNLLCSVIPLTLIFDGQREILQTTLPDVSDADLLGTRLPAKDANNLHVFRFQGRTPNTELAFGLAYRSQDNRATFLGSPDSSVMSFLGGIKQPRTSVCGFSVPIRPAHLCIDLQRVGTYFANARTPSGFEFSIDRHTVVDNAATEKFSSEAADIFHDGYRQFLKQTGSYRPDAILSLQREAAMHGGNVYDVFTGGELARSKASMPDLVCVKLIPVVANVPFEEARRNAAVVNLDTLATTPGDLHCLQSVRSPMRYGPTTYVDPESANVVAFVYACAQSVAEHVEPCVPIYVVEPDRTFSMLFDCDPRATVVSLPLSGTTAHLLRVHLQSVDYKAAPSDVIADISGPWAGAIYLRKFHTTDAKPYLFLGRHRVLVQPNAPLAQYLQSLLAEQRTAKIAHTIHLLKEDEAGYPPSELEAYL